MRTPLLLAVSALLLSCQQGEPGVSFDTSIERQTKSIIGGTLNRADPSVVAVFAGGLCTGTLVAPEIVLTAAHCVGDAIVAGNTNSGGVRFGDGDSPWIDSINIVDMAMHRLYKPPAFLQHDIALVRLARPAPSEIPVLPISTQFLTEEDIGLQLRVVGFGNTDGEAGTGAGTKRQVTLPLKDVSPGHLTIGDHLYNTCQGDSGGPTFAMFAGQEYVVGVTSYGASGCAGLSALTRTDAMWDAFLTEVMSAWSGPCMQDNVCNDDPSCEYPDPDCDPCGMDGVCIRDCPRPDKDCPLEGLAGDSCQDTLGCESRTCATSPDDDRITYCSMSCDPTVRDSKSGCYAPLTICEDQGDGTGMCRFPGITPGAQGSACDDGSECRSGMCDSGDGICVEPCGGDLPECADGFQCSSLSDLQVCTLASDSGGCAVGSSESGPLSGILLLLALVFGARRRRRAL
jgi:MYXO-CTERM domain-containing protein